MLPGRSLLLVRNVRTPHAARRRAHRGRRAAAGGVPRHRSSPRSRRCTTCAGSAATPTPAPAACTSSSRRCTARTRSALSVDLFTAVEEALELPPTTIKIGIMDEERRTSINLEACIARAADRVIFVNTGFLDRTGDEIHTDFEAGPVVRKDDEKTTTWLHGVRRPQRRRRAARRVRRATPRSARACGPSPPAMRAMLDTKGAQPKAGANTAWVPSPTAATLHALHYLETDVMARAAGAGGAAPDRPAQAARACRCCPTVAPGSPTRRSATSWRRTRSRSSATSCAGWGWASAARRCRTWRASG